MLFPKKIEALFIYLNIPLLTVYVVVSAHRSNIIANTLEVIIREEGTLETVALLKRVATCCMQSAS